MMRLKPGHLLMSVAGIAVLLAACSSTPPATSSPTTTATALATKAAATAPAVTSPSATTSSTAAAIKKVSANTATSSEIQAALSAAGVPNPANWTREVIEYRPYPTNDANLTKLRQNLVKYNPAPGVVDAIVSALTP